MYGGRGEGGEGRGGGMSMRFVAVVGPVLQSSTDW